MNTKRIIASIITIAFFIIFKYLIPLKFYEKSPIILSFFFSIIISILSICTLTNIYSISRIKKIINSSENIAGVVLLIFITTFSIIGFTFYFTMNEKDRVENDLKYNSKKTDGIILDKYQLEQKLKIKKDVFTKVKVEYIVNGEKIISEHNSNLGLIQLPEKGSKVKILYSKNLPKNFIIDEVENSTKASTLEETMELIKQID